jgi:hypothetical protein
MPMMLKLRGLNIKTVHNEGWIFPVLIASLKHRQATETG